MFIETSRLCTGDLDRSFSIDPLSDKKDDNLARREARSRNRRRLVAKIIEGQLQAEYNEHIKGKEANRRKAEAYAKEIEGQFLEECKVQKQQKLEALAPVIFPFQGQDYQKKEDLFIQSTPLIIDAPALETASAVAISPVDESPSVHVEAKITTEKPPRKGPLAKIAAISSFVTAAVLAVTSCGPSQTLLREKEEKIQNLETQNDALLKQNIALSNQITELKVQNALEEGQNDKLLKEKEKKLEACEKEKTKVVPTPKAPPSKPKTYSKPHQKPTTVPPSVSKPPVVAPIPCPDESKKPDKTKQDYDIYNELEIQDNGLRESFLWRKIVKPVKNLLLKKDQGTEQVPTPGREQIPKLAEFNFTKAKILLSNLTKPGLKVPGDQKATIVAEISKFIVKWEKMGQSFSSQDLAEMSKQLRWLCSCVDQLLELSEEQITSLQEQISQQ